jgi:hypothetical protein
VDAVTAAAGPPSHSTFDTVAPLLCPSGEVALTFDTPASTLVVADVRVAATWAPSGEDSWDLAFALDRHLRAHPRGALAAAHADATLAPSEVSFEFDGPLTCPTVEEPVDAVVLPPPFAPEFAAAPALLPLDPLPPALYPGLVRFYARSLPAFGTLFNTADGSTPTTQVPAVMPALLSSSTLLLRIVDLEEVGDKSAVFRYSATDDGLGGRETLNRGFVCMVCPPPRQNPNPPGV